MILGCDVSQWQGDINHAVLKPAIDFAIVRASWGNGGSDTKFFQNRDAFRNLGVPLGFYHFCYPDYGNQAEAEADWFLKVVGTPRDNELLVLDFEVEYSDAVSWCKRFLDRISSRLDGYKPLIYLDLKRINQFDWSPVVKAGYGLWFAYWGANNDPNQDPAADIPSTDWNVVAMRQYTSNKTFPGVSGRVDANVFYGTLQQFNKYGYHQPVQPTPEPPQDPTLPLKEQIEKLNHRVGELESKNDELTRINKEIGQSNAEIIESNRKLQEKYNADTKQLTDRIIELQKKLDDLTNQPQPVPTPPSHQCQDDKIKPLVNVSWFEYIFNQDKIRRLLNL